MSDPLESFGDRPERKQTLSEINGSLNSWEARKEPGLFLRTLITYIEAAKYPDIEPARKMFRDIGSRLMLENSPFAYTDALVKGTAFDEVDFQNMHNLGDALFHIGQNAQTMKELLHDVRAGNEVVKRVAGEWWDDEVEPRVHKNV